MSISSPASGAMATSETSFLCLKVLAKDGCIGCFRIDVWYHFNGNFMMSKLVVEVM